jgi:hypothetical protein
MIASKRFESPDKWADMEAWHLLLWIKILAKDIERTDAFALATMLFYKIKRSLYFQLQPAQHVQLKNTLAFLAESNGLNRWLIQTIKPLPWLRFIGPQNRLSTSTIQEFRLAEKYYLLYQASQNENYIDLLIATLYRPKGLSEEQRDYRIQLTELLVDKNGQKMRRLSKTVRAAIVFNYEGCRNFIFAKYPTIFKPSAGGKKSTTIPDLEGLIKTVAGGKFGTFKETNDTGLYLFLDHLADEIEADEQLKRTKK